MTVTEMIFVDRRLPTKYNFMDSRAEGGILRYPTGLEFFDESLEPGWAECVEPIRDRLPKYVYQVNFGPILDWDKGDDRIRAINQSLRDLILFEHIIKTYGVSPLYIRLHIDTKLSLSHLDNIKDFHLGELDLRPGHEPTELVFDIDQFYRFVL